MLDVLALTGPIFLVIAAGWLATRAGLFARADMRVFGKYYDPTTPAEGSAGLAVIDHWTCSAHLKVATCTLRATTIQARG